MMSSPSENRPNLSHRGLAVVGVRLLALYLLVQVPIVLAHALAGTDAGRAPLTPVAGAVAIIAGTALLLWLLTGVLASLMVPARRALSAEVGAPGDFRGAARLGFALLGLYLVADALPRLLVDAWLLSDTHDLPALVAVPALRCLLGLAIMVGSDGLARLFGVLRYAGRT